MKRIMFNDWQEMALKKDIEKIIRRMDSNNTVFYSVCWEITLTFAAIFVENIIHIENAKKCIVLFFIFLLAVIPPLVIIVAKVTVLIFRILKSRKGNYSVREFVDVFDNQVSYWVMMSNSYAKILSEMENTEEEFIFIYQEGCYYNNKAMDELYKMKPVIDKVFSNMQEIVKRKKLVELQRLINTQALIIANQNMLDKCIVQCENLPPIVEQRKLNSEYKKAFDDFVNDVEKCFKAKSSSEFGVYG